MANLPPLLAPGDRIRAVAPSGAFDPAMFASGVELLEARGFQVVFDKGIFARERYLAGDDERRLTEFVQALADPTTKAVWAARGGYGAGRLLSQLSVDHVVGAEKWLIGFSDITALHALWSRADLCSLHAGNVVTLASWSAAAVDELFACLTCPRPQRFVGKCLRPGPPLCGELRGGNLTVLASLAGTGHLPSFADAVVLVEDVGERPYRLDRSLTQLAQAGAWRGVRAFLVGQLRRCTQDGSANEPTEALEVIAERLGDLDVPILCDLPLGHEASARPALLGAMAELEPHSAEVRLLPPGLHG